MASHHATARLGGLILALCLVDVASERPPLNYAPLKTALETAYPRKTFSDLVSPRLGVAGLLGRDVGTEHRALLQAEEDACFWTSDDGCRVSGPASLDFLERVDNPVADYVQRNLICNLATSERACKAANCDWAAPSFCFVPHSEFREFHSVNCLSEVDHLIERRAGTLECGARDTEAGCIASEICYWDEEACSFDLWYHFYGIRSDGAFPSGFDDVLPLVQEDLGAQIQGLLLNGEIATWSDLLDWDPEPTVCPKAIPEPVCDYTNALSPWLVTGFYCNLQYPTAVELLDCESDIRCEVDTSGTGRLCQAHPDVVLPAIYGAQQVFADGIEDPEARLQQQKTLQCGSQQNAFDCGSTADCIWRPSDDLCFLGEPWLAGEIYRLVGDAENPVCQYYVLDTISGCVELDNKSDCEKNRLCFYSERNLECTAGIYGEIEFALGVSGSIDTFEEQLESCGAARSEIACGNVELVIPSPSSDSAPSEEAPESSEHAEKSKAGSRGHRKKGKTESHGHDEESEEVESHGHDEESEEVESHGHDEESEEVESHGHDEESEEVESHGHDEESKPKSRGHAEESEAESHEHAEISRAESNEHGEPDPPSSEEAVGSDGDYDIYDYFIDAFANDDMHGGMVDFGTEEHGEETPAEEHGEETPAEEHGEETPAEEHGEGSSDLQRARDFSAEGGLFGSGR